MSSKKTFFLLLGTLGLVIVALFGSAYGTDMLLQKQSKKLIGLKNQDQVLNQQKLILAKDKEDIKSYSSLEQIAKSIVPQDKDQAEAVREIVNIASQSGIKLSTISFPSSSLGTVTSGATSSSTSSSSSTSTASGSSGTLSQLVPVTGITGVYDLKITIQGDPSSPIPYSSFINFLGRLENNRRTAQVSSISLQPFQKDRSLLTFTLILDEYIKP